MQFNHLGQNSQYPNSYDPSLIQVVQRNKPQNMPEVFYGFDLWWAYEVSWLDNNNKPHVAIAELIFPAESKMLVESKSLKLYLNSFNMQIVDDHLTLEQIIKSDLEHSFNSNVQVKIILPKDWRHKERKNLYKCLDEQEIRCEFTEINPRLLKTNSNLVTENLMSNLLKSNCLITNQPDWGSIFISYQGQQIDHAGLLKYIVSYRNHNGFHENCLDRCFADILEYCKPDKLVIHAQYTRRGGIDINPVRSNYPVDEFTVLRSYRQ